MTGTTCLHAMIVPRRLIAQTRSKASSLSSSSGLSPPPNADPDIVVQDINAAPARPSRLHRGGERLFLGHVGGEGYALATLRRHRRGLLGGGDKPVDGQDSGAFLREAERRRTAVPDPLTGALPGPNDYSDLAFETHGSTPRNRCSRMPLWCLPSQVSPDVPHRGRSPDPGKPRLLHWQETSRGISLAMPPPLLLLQ